MDVSWSIPVSQSILAAILVLLFQIVIKYFIDGYRNARYLAVLGILRDTKFPMFMGHPLYRISWNSILVITGMVKIDMGTTIGRIKNQRRPFDYLEKHSSDKIGHIVTDRYKTHKTSIYHIKTVVICLLKQVYRIDSLMFPSHYRYSDPPCHFFGKHQISYVFIIEQLLNDTDPVRIVEKMIQKAFEVELFADEIYGAINSGHLLLVDQFISTDVNWASINVMVTDEAKRILYEMKISQ